MEFDKVIENRCSIRDYDDREVSENDLEKIVHAGHRAPIAKGLYENMAITVISDKNLIKEIEDEARAIKGKKDYKPLYKAPVLIIVSAKDDHESKREDTACIIENMTLKATELNLGSCYIRGIFERFDKDAKFIKKLNLDEDFYPVHGLILGHTKDELRGRVHHIKTNYIKA